MITFGATFPTRIVFWVVPTPPSLSVAVRVTTKVPLSGGCSVNEGPLPAANGAPSLVTDQVKRCVSAVPGSAAVAVRLIVSPSNAAAGAPMIDGTGLTLVAVTD